MSPAKLSSLPVTLSARWSARRPGAHGAHEEAAAGELEAALRIVTARNADAMVRLLERLPSTGLLLALIPVTPQLGTGDKSPFPAASELPLLPSQIDWVRASANYLEFRFGPDMMLKRMTMVQAEQALRNHGFVRIHRSALVNCERVRALEHGKVADEVVLLDGTRLRVGGIYRAAVRRILIPSA